MEPEYLGWCRGCNCYSAHLKLRPVLNKNTGTIEVSLFCDLCRKRFGLFPYDKQEVEGEKYDTISKNDRSDSVLSGTKL